MATFHLLVGLGVVGAVVLRRRRVRLYPLVLPVAAVAVAGLATAGTTRLRAPAEVCLVVLAAVAVDAALRRLERRRRDRRHGRRGRRGDPFGDVRSGGHPLVDDPFAAFDEEGLADDPFAGDRFDTGGRPVPVGSAHRLAPLTGDVQVPAPRDRSDRPVRLGVAVLVVAALMGAAGAAGAWMAAGTGAATAAAESGP